MATGSWRRSGTLESSRQLRILAEIRSRQPAIPPEPGGARHARAAPAGVPPCGSRALHASAVALVPEPHHLSELREVDGSRERPGRWHDELEAAPSFAELECLAEDGAHRGGVENGAAGQIEDEMAVDLAKSRDELPTTANVVVAVHLRQRDRPPSVAQAAAYPDAGRRSTSLHGFHLPEGPGCKLSEQLTKYLGGCSFDRRAGARAAAGGARTGR
jgi:hypothetical protein